MKPKGEISSVDCGAIQNNVNSLLLGIETLCFGAVTLRDDSAKRSQTEYDTVLLPAKPAGIPPQNPVYP